MTKYYFNKLNDENQAITAEKGLIIDGQNIKFYKNGSVKSFSFTGTVNATRSRLENLPKLGRTFTGFFTTEDNHSTEYNSSINAFAYLRSNIINNIDSINRWPT